MRKQEEKNREKQKDGGYKKTKVIGSKYEENEWLLSDVKSRILSLGAGMAKGRGGGSCYTTRSVVAQLATEDQLPHLRVYEVFDELINNIYCYYRIILLTSYLLSV